MSRGKLIFTVFLLVSLSLLLFMVNGNNPVTGGVVQAAGGCSGGSPTGFSFTDFSNLANLCLVGNANTTTTSDGMVLRLTPALNNQSGSTWYATKQNLSAGFQTIFKFRLSHSISDHADGITFAIQTESTAALGSNGCDIGYSGITKSLVVEFDTWANPPAGGCNDTNDPNNNHIAIHTKGAAANSRIHTTTPPDWGILEDGNDVGNGNAHVARIIYAPTNILGTSYTGVMRIFVDDFPVYSQAVNLSPILASGQAWVGFTAATAAAYENHDIIYWYFVTATQVTNSGDDVANPPAGSLRQIVNQLNTNTPAHPIITFSPSITSIKLKGPINILTDMTIDAGGMQVPQTKNSDGTIDNGERFNLTISCDSLAVNCSDFNEQAVRIDTNDNVTVYIGGMKLSGFAPQANGGVIFNLQALILTNVIIENSSSNYNTNQGSGTGQGGAIYNSGYLVIDSSTIRLVTAHLAGGGIFNSNTGTVVMKSSTINNNRANTFPSTPPSGTTGGGAIADFAPGRSLDIYSTTFDSNSAIQGGAIYANSTSGLPVIQNSTLTKNYSTSLGGGAIFGDSAGIQPVLVNVSVAYNRVRQNTQQGAIKASSIALYNTFIANSQLVDANGALIPGSTSNNCAGTIVDFTSNLSSDNTCGFAPGNSGLTMQLDTDIFPRGGLTWTLAIFASSPAKDRGDQTVCSASLVLYDQRGPAYFRTRDVQCDVGAYELQ